MGQDTQRKYQTIICSLAVGLFAITLLDMGFHTVFGFFIEDLPSNIVIEYDE